MSKLKIDKLSSAEKRRIEQWMQQGLVLHQSGRMREAEGLYREVLKRQPQHAAANHLLGLARLQAGEPAAAAELIARAVAQRPLDPQYHCNLGVALNAAGQPDPAILSLDRAIELKPDYAEAWSNRGMALKNAGRLEEAIESYREAIARKPREPGFHLNLARAHAAMGDVHEAESAYRRALDLRPNYPAALAGLCRTLEALGRPGEAVAAGQAAVKMRPDDIENHRALGRAHRAAGDLEQAEQSYRRVLQIVPTEAETYRLLSELVCRSAHDDDIVAMERLYTSSAPGSEERMHLGYALGRAFDDLGDYPRSIDYFTEGNAIRRRAGRFSLEQASGEFRALSGLFEALLPAPLLEGGFRDEAPVFVVGLPRSGKTSIEAVLARHPQVHGAGEVRTLPRLANELIARHDLTHPGASLAAVPPAEFVALGAEYARSVRRLSPAASVVVDTMPLNFRLIGLIRLALPRARIVHCVREPLQHCVALFQKHFAHPGYEFACDFRELAGYYHLYLDLMASWHRLFPGFIADVDYAAVRADPEREGARLLQFCGLEPGDLAPETLESEPRLGMPVVHSEPEQRLRHYYPLLAGLRRSRR